MMEIKGFKDTIGWYDKNAEKYAESAEKVAPVHLVEKILSLLPKNPLILDAGCGSGRDSRLLTERGARVTGIDISFGLLNEAKKKNPGIAFVQGDLRELPMQSECFDGIWSHASLVHLETIADVEKVLTEFARVLKSGGVLNIYVKAQAGDEKTAVVKDSLSNHERFFRYYTEPELRDLATKAGFIVEETYMEDDLHGRSEVKWLALFARKST